MFSIYKFIYGRKDAEIAELREKISKYSKHNSEILVNYNKTISDQKEIIASLSLVNQIEGEEEERENFWNNKWTHSPITYQAQNKFNMDVRNFIIDRSVVFDHLKFSGNDDEKIVKINDWVKKNIKYTSDSVSEYWALSEETISTKKGDCEDGALLIKTLALINNIPDYKVKVVAGWVANPNKPSERTGHCYIIYLRKDDTWTTIDWCYFYNNYPVADRVEHKKDARYNPIENSLWFTFNKEFAFAQENVKVTGRVKNGT